jgi:hypothetical protein
LFNYKIEGTADEITMVLIDEEETLKHPPALIVL